MAIFSNPAHSNRSDTANQHTDSSDYYLHQYPGVYDKQYNLDMDSTSIESLNSDRVNVFIVFVFILELFVLIFVIVLEYFLR